MVRFALLRTVLDPLLAVEGPEGLVRLEFLPRAWEYRTRAHAIARTCFAPARVSAAGGEPPPAPALRVVEDPTAFEELRGQLAEYFTVRREAFDVRLDPRGTPFQTRVWQQLQRIPYGKLRTYRQIARALNRWPGGDADVDVHFV